MVVSGIANQIQHVIGYLLATILLFAALAKMKPRSNREFRTAISHLAAELTPGAVRLVAIIVVILEFTTATLIFSNEMAAFGLAVSAILFALFSGLFIRAVGGGQTVQCACFGTVSASQVGMAGIIRNLSFTALALLALPR